MKIIPIGVIHTPHKQATGTPLQPVFAQGTQGTVELFPEFVPGIKDLDGFERIWLIYWFDRASEAQLEVTPFLDTQTRGNALALPSQSHRHLVRAAQPYRRKCDPCPRSGYAGWNAASGHQTLCPRLRRSRGGAHRLVRHGQRHHCYCRRQV